MASDAPPTSPHPRQSAARKRRPRRSKQRLDANRANAGKSTGPRTLEGKQAVAANAALSTGPRTPEGKAVSSLNAFRHGLRASSRNALARASAEELELFELISVQLEQEFAPASIQEHLLLERLALVYVRLVRAYGIETASVADNTARGANWTRPAGLPQDIVILSGYDASAERSVVRLLRALRVARRDRRPSVAPTPTALPPLPLPSPERFAHPSSEHLAHREENMGPPVFEQTNQTHSTPPAANPAFPGAADAHPSLAPSHSPLAAAEIAIDARLDRLDGYLSDLDRVLPVITELPEEDRLMRGSDWEKRVLPCIDALRDHLRSGDMSPERKTRFGALVRRARDSLPAIRQIAPRHRLPSLDL